MAYKKKQINNIEIPARSPQTVQSPAIEKCSEILSKVNDLAIKIEESRDAVAAISRGKLKWFRKTKQLNEKTNALAENAVQQNYILSEMNDLIQETIVFSSISAAFALEVSDELGMMIKSGFKDRDGYTVELTDIGKKYAEKIQETMRETAIQSAKNKDDLCLKISQIEARERSRSLLLMVFVAIILSLLALLFVLK